MDLHNLFVELTGSTTQSTAHVAAVAALLRGMLTLPHTDASATLASLSALHTGNNNDLLRQIIGTEMLSNAQAEYAEAQNSTRSNGTNLTILFKDFRQCPLYVTPSTEEDDFL